MDVGVVGMGYLGCVLAAGHARAGRRVFAVESDAARRDLLRCGESPVDEPAVAEPLREGLRTGRIRVVDDAAQAIAQAPVVYVAVGTPGHADGRIDLAATEEACRQLGPGLAALERWHVVVFKSTMVPGTVEGRLVPLLERASGRRAGLGFGVCHEPEFLREGSGMADFLRPPMIVVGELDARSGEPLAELARGVEAPLLRTDLRTAEMIKYACNSFHALKVAFANEVGALCRHWGIDGRRLMEAFARDRLLNISPAYLQPGAPYGGSCLAKDLGALLFEARRLGEPTALLAAVPESNERHLERCVELVAGTGAAKVGVLGAGFKHDTDDVRGSPALALARRLVERGLDVTVYDRHLARSARPAQRLARLEEQEPLLAGRVRPGLDEVVREAQCVVVTSAGEDLRGLPALLRADQTLVDLPNLLDPAAVPARYLSPSRP